MGKATFGGGCFWCTEAIFERLNGVTKVTSGYAGGVMENPTYGDVSSGETNHAEVIQIEFDEKEISFKDLLYVFLKTHDPTDVGGQGADRGPQYRSIIFYENDIQKKIAEEELKNIQKDYGKPIVTEIVPLEKFYEAEGYHQNYYEKNKTVPYCRLVIDPKIEKLKKNFGKYLKRN